MREAETDHAPRPRGLPCLANDQEGIAGIDDLADAALAFGTIRRNGLESRGTFEHIVCIDVGDVCGIL